MSKNYLKPSVLKHPASPQQSFLYRFVSSQRFLAVIGLVFLVIIILPLARAYSQRRLVTQEISDVQKQINDYESQNQNLKDMISYLQSDQSLEEQARLNLNMKKPGEQVVVIKEQGGLSALGMATGPDTAAGGNFAKWWHYFFN